MSVASEIERIKNEVNSQSTIIDEISTILDSKAGSNPKLQEKTVMAKIKIVSNPYNYEVSF